MILRPPSPGTKGFQEFGGFLSQSHARDYYSDYIYRQDVAANKDRTETLPENWNDAQGRYTPGLVGQAAGNFIRINASDRFNHFAPFFLCAAYPVPHDGLPPKELPYENEPWPQPAKTRAAMMAHLDGSVGYVVKCLRDAKVETNTVVIFTSFGGPQKEGAMDPKFFNSAGPLRGHAGSVYEGGIRVPLIVYPLARAHQARPGQQRPMHCLGPDVDPGGHRHY